MTCMHQSNEVLLFKRTLYNESYNLFCNSPLFVLCFYVQIVCVQCLELIIATVFGCCC